MKIEITPGKFTNTWESLQQFECPEWYKNAKFGVWAHWGAQCVPMIGKGWYARDMYIEGSRDYKYHRKHYGHPSEVGYKDIVELWKAEKFDPDRLVKMYKDMGARFFVTIGVHHDNIDLWDSTYNSWNTVNHGPHKDIVGAWKESCKKYDMRFGVSEHLERSYSWFSTNKGADKRGKYKGVPYDGNDHKYQELYLDGSLEDTSCGYPKNPSERFVENFYLRIKELVEKYDPDFLYTDGGVPFGEVGRAMIANFYNHNMQVHDGKQEGVYAVKDITSIYHGDYVDGIGVLDLEREISSIPRKDVWESDTCLGLWFYMKNCRYKSADEVIQQLADVVSKNGVYLLSVPLKADGTIDDREEKIVAKIGDWFKINGEAIYDTEPYSICGEGPIIKRAKKGNLHKLRCKSSDIRFTKKDNYIYALCLNAKKGCIRIKSFGGKANQIAEITVFGASNCSWECTDKELIVRYDKSAIDEFAVHAMRITFKD